MSAVRGILELFRATKPNSTSSTPYATSSGNAMEASAANAMPPAGTNKVGEPPTTLHPRNSPNPSVIKARRGISAWCNTVFLAGFCASPFALRSAFCGRGIANPPLVPIEEREPRSLPGPIIASPAQRLRRRCEPAFGNRSSAAIYQINTKGGKALTQHFRNRLTPATACPAVRFSHTLTSTRKSIEDLRRRATGAGRRAEPESERTALHSEVRRRHARCPGNEKPSSSIDGEKEEPWNGKMSITLF